MVLFWLLLCFVANGALTPQPLPTKANSSPVKEGFYIGGKVHKITSLLNIYKQNFKKGTKERWTFSLGNERQQPFKDKNYLPYVQVNIDSKNNRLIIDFFQLNRSKITLKQIQSLTKKSQHIKSSNLLFDPLDSTASLVFYFKKPVQVKAFSSTGKLGPLSIEIESQN